MWLANQSISGFSTHCLFPIFPDRNEFIPLFLYIFLYSPFLFLYSPRLGYPILPDPNQNITQKLYIFFDSSSLFLTPLCLGYACLSFFCLPSFDFTMISLSFGTSLSTFCLLFLLSSFSSLFSLEEGLRFKKQGEQNKRYKGKYVKGSTGAPPLRK